MMTNKGRLSVDQRSTRSSQMRFSPSRLVNKPAAEILAVVFGAALFMLPAMLNGFPFLAPDSTRYLPHAVRLWYSPFYGWFIYLLHFDAFIWGVVVGQSLILSHLVFVVTKLHVPKSYRLPIFLGLALCLTAFSSLPYFSGLIMPDIFTAIMVLTLFILAFKFSQLRKAEKIYFFFLAFLSTSAHFSHLPIAVAIVAVAAILLFFLRQPWQKVGWRIAGLLVPVMLAAGAFFLTNLVIYGIAALSPAGPNFVLANMIEYGPARHYLQAACPAAGYKLCPYVNELPATANQFLWTPDFLLGRLDFVAEGKEASAIVAKTIETRPREVAHMFLETSFLALTSYAPATDLRLFERFEPEMNAALARFGPETQIGWRESAEHRGAVPRAFLSKLQDVVLPLVMLGLVIGCILAYKRGSLELLALPLFVTSAFIINAVVCGVTSGVFDRYQARVSWLLVLSAIILWVGLLASQRRASSAPISGQ
jgi:hypothetical protein